MDSAKWVVVYFLVSRIVVSSWRSKVFVVVLLLLNLKLAQFAIRLYLQYGTMEQGGQSVAMVGLGANDFFGNSNDFGVGMCVVLPLAVSLFTGESKLLARLTYLASSLGIFVAMLLSGCRGAFAATCTAALVFLVRGNRKMAAVLVGLLIVIGTLFLLPQGNLDRLRSALSPEGDQSATQRIGFWKASFKMFESNPLTGVGPGNFAPTFRDHYSVVEKDPGLGPPTASTFRVLRNWAFWEQFRFSSSGDWLYGSTGKHAGSSSGREPPRNALNSAWRSDSRWPSWHFW